MIEINIKQTDQQDENPYESYAYKLESNILIDDTANATEVVAAFCKAMEIEGYQLSTIANAMYNYSKYMAFEYNLALKEDED